jgi:hypothetical protein
MASQWIRCSVSLRIFRSASAPASVARPTPGASAPHLPVHPRKTASTSSKVESRACRIDHSPRSCDIRKCARPGCDAAIGSVTRLRPYRQSSGWRFTCQGQLSLPPRGYGGTCAPAAERHRRLACPTCSLAIGVARHRCRRLPVPVTGIPTKSALRDETLFCTPSRAGSNP